jgi:acetylornithine deacetylase/succinyl-diaminopimelate desuccinylase-like protein
VVAKRPSGKRILLLLVIATLGTALMRHDTVELHAEDRVAASGKAAVDPARYRRAVAHLASEEMDGRRVGTPGGRRAIDYIRSAFAGIGLQPRRDRSYLQHYDHDFKGTAKATNVVGILPGSDPLLKRQAVIVTAHFDHLGRNRDDGCPNGKRGNCIKYGANDNATGVAALFEIAYAFMAVRKKVKRTIVFVAFDGEECGCTGSNHYVFRDPDFLPNQTVLAVNIDQIGRGGRMTTHKIDKHTGFGEDCDVDGEVFARRGMRAVTFVGKNHNYHQCTDTVDTIDFGKAIDTVHRAFELAWEAAQGAAD